MSRLLTLSAALLAAPAMAFAGYQVSSGVATTLAGAPLPQPSPAHAQAETQRLFVAEHHDLRTDVLDAVRVGGGVPLGHGSCPERRLELSYTDPGKGYGSGAFVLPLGPAPTDSTRSVNGVVLCRGSKDGYVGFDAFLLDDGWDVALVPDVSGGVDDEVPGVNVPDTKPVPPGVKNHAASGFTGKATGAAIEGFAAYEGQTTCSPDPKPGTVALRNLLLARYPSTTSLGISRGCGVGGQSEHKEGRAFDWGASAGDPKDVAAVHDFFAHLFAADSSGNPDALVRRMGIMYVIWDHQIWSAYRAGEGWRPYSGANPHTDHVHISLSWAGARAQTSYWSGTVVEGLSATPVGATVTSASARHSDRGHGKETGTAAGVARHARTGGQTWSGGRSWPTVRPTAWPRPATRPTSWPTAWPTSWPHSWPTARPTTWSGRPRHSSGSGSSAPGPQPTAAPMDPVPAPALTLASTSGSGSWSGGTRSWHH